MCGLAGRLVAPSWVFFFLNYPRASANGVSLHSKYQERTREPDVSTKGPQLNPLYFYCCHRCCHEKGSTPHNSLCSFYSWDDAFSHPYPVVGCSGSPHMCPCSYSHWWLHAHAQEPYFWTLPQTSRPWGWDQTNSSRCFKLFLTFRYHLIHSKLPKMIWKGIFKLLVSFVS